MVAGEASGDFLGAHLIAALRRRLPGARFAGVGGPQMEAQGFEAWHAMERLAVRGYAEVLRHYPGLVRLRRRLVAALGAERPALFIGIDAPDFNLGLEAMLKRRGVPTLHYVSPSVWAWRGWRMRAIARAADHVLVLFPFEQTIYERAGIPATYVGHPMADLIPEADQTAAAREQLRIAPGDTVVALLPGSRQSELRYHAAIFIRTARIIAARRPDVRFLAPLVSRETRNLFEAALYEQGAQDLPLTVLFGHAREAIAAADNVLVASGTATLETALLKKPMVITYRMAKSSYRIMSRLRYQPWVGLPNIIAGKFVVPELLQDDAEPENLAQALLNQLTDLQVRRRTERCFAHMHRQLRRNTADRAAEAVLASLR
jgi:lipid-A-disaccharide synthase